MRLQVKLDNYFQLATDTIFHGMLERFIHIKYYKSSYLEMCQLGIILMIVVIQHKATATNRAKIYVNGFK
jgi:hypothetical protein